MNSPYLFITGVGLIGFLLPELIVAAFKVRVPWLFNYTFALGCGLIAASFVL